MTTDKAPTKGDSLGDRIKAYEAVSRPFLTPNMPVIIRVDGKAFHTWTKGMDKPFDHRLMDCMVKATRAVAKEMQGFKLAYTQSDEATFMISDTDSHEQQGWYGYNANKLVSITASMFTAYFNREVRWWGSDGWAPAFFDARAFSVPADDAPNVFLWRQRDWERNSVSMSAQYFFSHGQLQGKKTADMHEMMFKTFGFNWADLQPEEKNGTFVTRNDALCCEKLGYDGISGLINPVPLAVGGTQ